MKRERGGDGHDDGMVATSRDGHPCTTKHNKVAGKKPEYVDKNKKMIGAKCEKKKSTELGMMTKNRRAPRGHEQSNKNESFGQVSALNGKKEEATYSGGASSVADLHKIYAGGNRS